MTANARLALIFRDNADRPLFMISEDRWLTYAAALANAEALAADWRMQGAREGDAVALVLDNSLGFACAYLACLAGGFVAAPVNPELTQDDIDYILQLLQPALTLRDTPAVRYSLPPPSGQSFARDEKACAAVFFTSGTTGRPKGVRHSLAALLGNVESFNHAFDIDADACMYHTMPMAYMAGFLNTLLSPIAAGARVALGPRFSPQSALDFWSLPRRLGVNTMWLTPSMAAALTRVARDANAARRAAADLRRIFCGTAPLHPHVRRQFLEIFGVPLQESYGTSELLLIAAQTRDAAERLDENVGAPLPEIEFSFEADAEGRDSMSIRSPFAMLGYLPEDAEGSMQGRPGWMSTGDAGVVADGVLQITGRIKDLIIRGGVNISPRAIESALGGLPGVLDIAVVGMPHNFWGEAIAICLQAEPDADREALETATRARCRERLPRNQQPDRIAILNAFPRTTTGKVRKQALADQLR